MISAPKSTSDVLIVRKKTYEQLPTINKAVLLMMCENGEARIVDDLGNEMTGLYHRSPNGEHNGKDGTCGADGAGRKCSL